MNVNIIAIGFNTKIYILVYVLANIPSNIAIYYISYYINTTLDYLT